MTTPKKILNHRPSKGRKIWSGSCKIFVKIHLLRIVQSSGFKVQGSKFKVGWMPTGTFHDLQVAEGCRGHRAHRLAWAAGGEARPTRLFIIRSEIPITFSLTLILSPMGGEGIKKGLF
jgi:hypothetical protein